MSGRFRSAAIVLIAVVIAAGAAAWLLRGALQPQAGFTVLTAAELETYTSQPAVDSPGRTITLTASDGPQIKVAAPSGFALTSPVDFDIRIQPRDGRPANMDTLKIEYRLGPAWVNLTKRIMKRASVSGERFLAQGAELPAGNHTLRVSIKDDASKLTQAVVTFSVK